MTTMEQRVSVLEGIYPHLATKEDVAGVRAEVAQLRGDLSTEIAQLRGDLSTEIAQTRGDLSTEIVQTRGDLTSAMARYQGDLTAEIARSESRMVRWMAAWTIGGMLGIAGLVITVAKFLA